MELRSFNVERVWRECVKIRIKNELGVNHEALSAHADDIRSMVSQLALKEGKARMFITRTDGEQWTPYMQIVEMLLLLGAKIGIVELDGELNPQTNVKILV